MIKLLCTILLMFVLSNCKLDEDFSLKTREQLCWGKMWRDKEYRYRLLYVEKHLKKNDSLISVKTWTLIISLQHPGFNTMKTK